MLQSNSKEFADSILNRILKAVKMMEDGYGPPTTAQAPGTVPNATRSAGHMPYSRYDQERFHNRQDEDTALFGIVDTAGTYHGINLQSVAAGGVANKPTDPRQSTKLPSGDPRNVQPQDPRRTPVTSGGSSSGTPRSGSTTPGSASRGVREKRTPRTPIVIIPVAASSLISMLNAKDLLQV